MTDPKSDPRRRCLPLAEWPLADQEAWYAAIRDGGLLDDRGLALHWRPETRRSVIAAYGRYLTFLDRTGALDRSAGPDARLTPDRLRAYISELGTQVASVTQAGRIRDLAEALRVMTPGASYPYLVMARRRLKARARPTRNKRSRVVPTNRLVDLGLDLMERAETQPFKREVWRACTYRDGLTILLLALRPIRRSNLAAMKLNQHLFKIGEAYQLAFDGTITKNHRPYDRPLDPRLTPYIERYLDHYRPALVGAGESGYVWISWRGIPMSECSLYGKIVQHTKAAFGHSHSPHLFRDSDMTTLAELNPEHVWLGMSLFHHSDPRPSEEHYNHALDRTAVERFQDTIHKERRRIRGATRKSSLK